MSNEEWQELCELLDAYDESYQCEHITHTGLCLLSTGTCTNCDKAQYKKHKLLESADKREGLEELVIDRCRNIYFSRNKGGWYHCGIVSSDYYSIKGTPTRPQALYKLIIELIKQDVLDKDAVKEVIK